MRPPRSSPCIAAEIDRHFKPDKCLRTSAYSKLHHCEKRKYPISPVGVTGGKQSSKPFTCKRLKYKNRDLERSQYPTPERKTMDNETEREGKMVTFNVKTTRDPLSEKSGNEITRFRKTKSQQQRVGFDGLARPEGFEPPTNGFGSHYSYPLSYERVIANDTKPRA